MRGEGGGGAAPAAPPVAALAAGGGAGSTGLLLAMAIGGPGDGLMTRDAATIEEYVLLMAEEAGREEEGGAGRDAVGLLGWPQVGTRFVFVWASG